MFTAPDRSALQGCITRYTHANPNSARQPVSYTHLTLPTSDLV